jgi:transposase-like protein
VEDFMTNEQNKDNGQRWTTKRKAALVLSILKGEISIQEAARQNSLTVAEIDEWKDRFILGAENALRSKPKDEDALKEEHIKKLERKIGQLVMDVDILKAASKLRPSTPGTSEE